MSNKDVILDIDTEEFVLTFIGPVPCNNSYILKDFNGAESYENESPSEVLNIFYKSDKISIPIIQLSSRSEKYKRSNVKIELNTKFEYDNQIKYLPIFFETINYQVQLKSKSNSKFVLWHEHSTINNDLAYFEKQKSFCGTFNFRNEVGVSNFYIKENDKIVMLLTFTVFSLKIDFLNDRYHMLRDLLGINDTIVFDLFRPTKSEGILEQHRKANGLEWLVNFYNTCDSIVQILKRIEKKSHNNLKSEVATVKVHSINKQNKSLNKQIQKHGKRELLNRRIIDIEIKRCDPDTPENRYIKYLTSRVIKKLNRWITYIDSEESRRFKAIQKEYTYLRIIDSGRKINNILKNQFWSKISNDSSTIENKTNFLFHSEFIKCEKLCRILSRAIDIQMSGTQYLYTLPMNDLYELWTYFKIGEIISYIVYKDENKISLKIDETPFGVTLKTGKRSTIKINNNIAIATNRLFTSITNPFFSPLVSQKPDIIFEIRNRNELNIFDAKYKMDIQAEDKKEFKSLSNAELISKDLSGVKVRYSPKDEDINTMHRYKDAIRLNTNGETTNQERVVKKAIILFPYKPIVSEMEFVSDYISSLDKYEIGAIPLSPGIKDNEWINNYMIKENLVIDNINSREKEQVRILANQLSCMLNISVDD